MRSSAPPVSSYSLACARNAFRSICVMSPPPANLRLTRSDAVASWQASSPARSDDSSLLRNHSSSASWIGRMAIPARNGRAPRLTLRMMTRMVWYSACRSEEHTPELQSRLHLVCRLLLEKKKKETCTQQVDSSTHRSAATSRAVTACHFSYL